MKIPILMRKRREISFRFFKEVKTYRQQNNDNFRRINDGN